MYKLSYTFGGAKSVGDYFVGCTYANAEKLKSYSYATQLQRSLDQIITITKANSQLSHIRCMVNSLPNAAYYKCKPKSHEAIVNQKFKELLGLDSALKVSEEFSQQQNHFIKAVEKLEKDAFKTKTEVKKHLLPPLLAENGQVARLSISISFIRDNTGDIIGLLAYFIDITETLPSRDLLALYSELYESSKESLTHFIAHIGLSKEITGNNETLTQREIDCLISLADGKTAKETARDLNISHRTVETHLQNIKIKFDATTKTEILGIFMKYFKV